MLWRFIISKILPAALILTCVLVAEALADNSVGFTRADYTLIMKWVNFGILAALVIKYARRPIAVFLKDKKAEVAKSIQQLEEEKRRMEVQMREIRLQLEAGQERLTLIKERIVADGQRRKEAIIADAQEESRLLLSTAKFKIEAGIRESSQSFRAELIDMAVDLAAARLPQLLGPQDHERMIANWMNAAGK